MANPANPTEIQACVDAGVDLMVVWAAQLEQARQIAPHHFMGIGSTWAELGTDDEILAHAVELMGRVGVFAVEVECIAEEVRA